MRSLGLGLGLGRGCLTIIGGGAPGDGGEEPTNTYFTDFSDAKVFEGGQGLQHDAPSGQRAVSWDSPGGALTDVDVVAIVVAPTIEDDRRMRVVVRGGGAGGTEDGYLFEATGFSGSDWTLWKVVAGTFTQLGSAAESVEPATRYVMRFRVEGTALKARYWPYGEAEPATWLFEETDADLSSGWIGFSGRDTNSYLDYFAVDTGGGSAPLPDETPGANQEATDFSGQTADAAPSGWTEEWDTSSSTWTVVDDAGLPPLGWTVRGGAGHLWTVVADATATGGQVLDHESHVLSLGFLTADAADALSARDEVEVVVRMKVLSISTARPNAGAAARIDADASDSYSFSIRSTSTVQLYQWESEIGSAATVSITESDWFWMRLQVHGTALKGRIWQDGDEEPATWTIEETDANITAAGHIGIAAMSADAQYDLVGIGTGGATAPTS